jgi:hypothetical protein
MHKILLALVERDKVLIGDAERELEDADGGVRDPGGGCLGVRSEGGTC